MSRKRLGRRERIKARERKKAVNAAVARNERGFDCLVAEARLSRAYRLTKAYDAEAVLSRTHLSSVRVIHNHEGSLPNKAGDYAKAVNAKAKQLESDARCEARHKAAHNKRRAKENLPPL